MLSYMSLMARPWLHIAMMAADEITDFIEHGIIRNSVNYPETLLPKRGTVSTDASGSRLCVFNKNETGTLGEITGRLGGEIVGNLCDRFLCQ